ncbi:glycosyltransferase [Heyndrickxia faecalis]|uniref:glycosyltransferase n=1 Tax=Heyndrickxia TaxID=2837504 RepID=UPI001A954149|nr:MULTISPECIES: glycosyltransferase [Heyndrickxia]MED4976441.1 glycosyltransferase [Weizmannia sp. CD-2023]
MNFSVLMSLYWKEVPEYLDSSLNSIVNQSLMPSEIVIIKDGPLNENLENILYKYVINYPKLFKIIGLKKNVGLGRALEIGLKHCTYEIVARMDTDDIALYNRFEKQIPLIQNDTSISALGSWIAEFDNNPSELKTIRKVPLDYEEILDKARYRNPLNHMSVVFRKSAVLSVGNYQSFLWNEDYYLWVRLLINGYKIINTNDVLLYVRTGEDMFNRRGGITYFKNEIRLQKKFLELKYIKRTDFIRNILTRGIVRILPNKLRSTIYRTLLRNKFDK